jgi:RHS repeat-associated protein
MRSGVITITMLSRAVSATVAVILVATVAIAGAPPVFAAVPDFARLKPVKGSTAAPLSAVKLDADAVTDRVATVSIPAGDVFEVALTPLPATPAPATPPATPTPTPAATPTSLPTSSPSSTPTSTPIPVASEGAVAPAALADAAPDTLPLGTWKPVGTTGISVASGAPATSSLNTIGPDADPVQELSVSFLEPAAFADQGATRLVVRLARADDGDGAAPVSVKVPSDVLDGLFGGDFGSRLRWAVVPDGSPNARSAATPLASTTDSNGNTILTTRPSGSSVTLAAMSTPTSSSGMGTYAATPLGGSGTWDVSAQTGAFSWAYPMAVAPAAAGPAPELAFSYDSQSVDGLTSATNNQSSPVGIGWSLSTGGFIEREYVSCSEDDGVGSAHTTSGDLCWKEDNASISFGGHSGPMIKDTSSAAWKFQNDDGTRIVHAVGGGAGACTPSATKNGTWDNDCWIVTTTDGTKYYFGLNVLPSSSGTVVPTKSAWTVPVFGDDPGEPCYNATFASASCMQAWRWNLDYVVDASGNAESLYYNAETNKYRRNGTTVVSYTRGGSLEHIDYGFRENTAYIANSASDRVVFTYDAKGRCVDTANCTNESVNGPGTVPAQPGKYPDTPWDQYCNDATCSGMLSPTFWTTAMLATVKTQARTAATVYALVDTWTLSHTFPSPGDGSTALWFSSVAHSGTAGTTTLNEPATVFDPVPLQNRVNYDFDGLSFLDAMRLQVVHMSTGGVLSVNYSPQECDQGDRASIIAHPESNTKRCFPQWWTPQTTPPIAARKDIFHKYVVTSFIANPITGGGGDAPLETHYSYGTPAWRYNTSRFVLSKYRTWSEFAGYDKVEITEGSVAHPESQRDTVYYFFQGMDGDRASESGGSRSVAVHVPGGAPDVTDALWFAGQTRYVETYDSASSAHNLNSAVLTTPWASNVTADNGSRKARATGDGTVVTSQPLSAGGNVTVTSTTAHDNATLYWLPTSEEEMHSDGGSTCALYAYAASSALISGLQQEVKVVATPCAAAATAALPAQAISDTRFSYDGGAPGAVPTRGLLSRTEVVDDYTGSPASPHWVTTAQSTYDTLGRPLVATDALGRTTSTAYTPVASGPLTKAVTTITAPFLWTTTSNIDPTRGNETSVVDPNGRTTTIAYDALGRRTGVWKPDRPVATNPQPSVGYAYTLSTTSPNAVATSTVGPLGFITSYDLYDGLGRSVQTQSPADGTGTIVTANRFDTVGRIIGTDSPYWTTSTSPSAALFMPISQSAVPSWTSTTLDGLDRSVVGTLGSYGDEISQTATSYSGADKVSIDPPAGGTPTSTFTNSLGQVTRLVQYDADAPTPGSDTIETTYSYDIGGQLVRMEDADGNEWTWQYNLLGNQIGATDPDTGHTASTYDILGNLLTTTDARGTSVTRTYDALNRQTATYEGATSSGAKLASWVYDTVAKGDVTSESSYTGSVPGTLGMEYKVTYTGYDAMDRPLGTTLSIPVGAPAFGGQTFTTSQTYNKSGQVSKVNYPAMGGLPAESLTYSYEELGLQTGISGGDLFVNADYNPLGQLGYIDRTGTNDLMTSYGYNVTTGATDIIDNRLNSGSGFQVISTTNYKRDLSGNMTSVSAVSPTSTDTQCFSHDHLGALTEAWTPADSDCNTSPGSATLGGPAPFWQSYSVDNVTHNRQQIVRHGFGSAPTSTDTYAYPAGGTSHPHAVQSIARVAGAASTSDAYTYDDIGGTKTRPGETLAYDALGRISSIGKGGNIQARVYSGSGSLLLQTDPIEGTTLFLADTQLIAAPGGGATTASRSYTLAGLQVAEKNTSVGVSGSSTKWTGTNDQATPLLEVDATTGATTRRYIDPYGDERGPSAAWSSSRSFLDMPESAMTGLIQLGARAYDPAIGRFLSVDVELSPFEPRQNSGYSYGYNDPATSSDPSGHRPDPTGNGPPNTPTRHQGGPNSHTPAPAGGNGSSVTSPFPGLGGKTYHTGPGVKIVAWDAPQTIEEAGLCGGSMSFNQQACEPEFREPQPINCAVYNGDPGCTPAPIVSMDPRQWAINDAFADAQWEKQISTLWAPLQFYAHYHRFTGELGSQIVTLGIAGGGGGVLGAGAATAEAGAATTGGIGPVLKGQAGVKAAIAEFEATGGSVLGREVTLEAGGVRIRTDLWVRHPDGSEGPLEVKNGPFARPTKNQAIGYPAVEATGFVPRGQNAVRAGLTPGQKYGPTPVTYAKFK